MKFVHILFYHLEKHLFYILSALSGGWPPSHAILLDFYAAILNRLLEAVSLQHHLHEEAPLGFVCLRQDQILDAAHKPYGNVDIRRRRRGLTLVLVRWSVGVAMARI